MEKGLNMSEHGDPPPRQPTARDCGKLELNRERVIRLRFVSLLPTTFCGPCLACIRRLYAGHGFVI
jgi:hypothetical protein